MKNFRSILACMVALSVCGLSSAADTYINMWKSINVWQMGGYSSHIALSQDGGSCKEKSVQLAEYSCVDSRKVDTKTSAAQAINELLPANWAVSNTNAELRLLNDINLGEIDSSAVDLCRMNHMPIYFPKGKNARLNGDGHAFINICYSADLSRGNMTDPMGFFSKIEESTVENVFFKRVVLTVKDSRVGSKRDESILGNACMPMGAVAGHVVSSTLKDITLEDVTIRSPMAGGLAGYVQSSTVEGVTASDDILVYNALEISNAKGNYAGIKVNPWGSRYSVFLGGLIGVAEQVNLKNSLVRAKVQDSTSERTVSAIGGLVGLMSVSGSKNVGAPPRPIVVSEMNMVQNQAGTSYTKLYGGSSMGGFFGEFGVLGGAENSSESAPGLATLKNGDIFLSISGTRSDSAFVGGLIGRVVSKGAGLEVTRTHVQIKLSDSLVVEKKQSYNAGGFFGRIENDPKTATVGDFFSVTESSVSGTLRVVGDAQKVTNPEYQVSAALGGFVGWALFTSERKPFALDTSRVEIKSMIRSATKAPDVQGALVLDSLFVGGVVGRMDHVAAGPSGELALDTVFFNGKINVTDSTHHVFVGGVVGANFDQLGKLGEHPVSMNNVEARNDATPVVDVKRIALTDPLHVVANVGGLCGYCESVHSANMVSTRSEVVAENFVKGDKLNLGGLFGNARSVKNVSVTNFLSLGTVRTENVDDAILGSVGALYGNMNFSQKLSLSYGFHCDSKFENSLFGSTLLNGASLEDWLQQDDHYTYKSIFVCDESAESIQSVSSGFVASEEMQKKLFAEMLNEGQNVLVWTFVEGLNNEYPFFADRYHAPVILNDDVKIFSFYDDDGATLVARLVILPGEPMILPPGPKHPDLIFDKWTPDPTMIRETYQDFIAVYKSPAFPVRFFACDGVTLLDSQLVEFHKSAMAPETGSAAQEGYHFVEWSRFYSLVEDTIDVYAFCKVDVYNIVCMDGEDTLKVYKVAHGSYPDIEYPKKEMTEEYSYSFIRWDTPIQTAYGDAVYHAVFDSLKRQYTVVFADEGNTLMQATMDYGEMPSFNYTPYHPSTAEYEYIFTGWNPEVSEVRGDIVYKAVFNPQRRTYSVKMMNGSEVLQDSKWEYGSIPSYLGKIVPTRPASELYTYEFRGWSEIFSKVEGEQTYYAVFDSTIKTNHVVFMNYDDSILSSQEVPFGEGAVAPISPTRPSSHGVTYTFAGWDKSFDHVTDILVVRAVYTSSVEPPEDWGFQVAEISNSNIEQTGNAIRWMFDVKMLNLESKTKAYVRLKNEQGIVAESVLCDSVTPAFTHGIWQFAPVPVGHFTAELLLENQAGVTMATCEFDVSGKIEVTPRSWQMLSLAALDMKSLEDREDAAFFWWDESSPVGDYWQYRAYDFNETYAATQGFWYGTHNGNPLILKPETPSSDAKIVWNLDSRYSGWNLVANPHGWTVALDTGRSDISFWRWNSQEGQYTKPVVLRPYEAVWAKVSAPTTYEIEATPVFKSVESTSTMQARRLMKANATEGWSLQAILKGSDGFQDSWNFIGVGRPQSMDEPPAGMGRHVNLSIVEGKSRLAKSIRSTDDSEYLWNLDLSSNVDDDGSLSFDGIELLEKRGLHAYVTIGDRTIQVQKGKSIPVALKSETRRVVVQVSDKAPVSNKFRLAQFRMIPSAGALTVKFDLPAGQSGLPCSVDLVDVNGRIAMGDRAVSSVGTNVFSFVGVKSGVYYVRVKLGSQSFAARTMVR